MMLITLLVITDTRKITSERDFDIVTAILTSQEVHDASRLISLDKKSYNDPLILESAMADKELPSIGVQKGDQFLRIWAPSGHGLFTGEKLRLSRDEV